jgi:hypothetical protein
MKRKRNSFQRFVGLFKGWPPLWWVKLSLVRRGYSLQDQREGVARIEAMVADALEKHTAANNNLTGQVDKDCSVEGVVGQPVAGYGPNAVRGVNGGISCKVCGLSIHSCGGFHPDATAHRESDTCDHMPDDATSGWRECKKCGKILELL